ncbi:MAG: DUF58 domain-containing protein [Deltaproteobacteria bacterium]|nr:DUF58 domain-containing protein [Deltaproteobacteria bacterium]
MANSALLDPEFVRELEVLRRRLHLTARSGGPGEHLARRRGGSAEFHEHRAYEPGDDLRRIDWAAYARTGEPVLKLFRAEEDVVARLVCDASASLGFGVPRKFDVVRRLAAALGYMTLAASERAQVVAAGGASVRAHPPARGRQGLPALLRSLDGLDAAGTTDLAKAVDAVVRESPRPGLLAIFSDFLDGGAWLAALGRAVAAGHDVALVHVLAPEEVAPTFDGDLAFEDAETGECVELVLDPGTLEAYERRLAGLFGALRAFAKRHGATYVRARTDAPLEPVIRRLVGRAVEP